jgi:hypothetical protein
MTPRGPKAKINFSMTGARMVDFWVRDEGRVLVQRNAARPTTTTTAFEMDGFKKNIKLRDAILKI